ncbi:MAG: hypothetical protein C4532_00535 [Candidatus Abyssobacteria bacterium SURF_17]|uniref:Carbohydrate kinase PfkB domain-containing protein n=1 Tax=Candidatus Abyssobacteria bacterium SURF_17 TaxID=2093361 RepID=A0A419F9Z2_9BACT|nr:MAG: hypothetical protein C4532_00535 [Candidatus Abyssubacteria bacterium SURF_17]
MEALVSVPDFLAVGHLCCDLVNGRRILGGSASYASLTARGLSRHTGIVTSVSRDFPFLDVFKGIEIRNIDSTTTTTFHNMYRNGVREQIVSGVATSISSTHIPPRWTDADIVYLCPIADEVMPDVIESFPRSLVGIGVQGWLREWDERGRVRRKEWKNAREVVRHADAVVYSELDLDEPYAFASELALFAPIVIVTQASRGAELFLKDRRVHVPAYRTEEVDPTGAGDVFAAAFLVRFKECDDPIEAAQFACCAASFVCEKEGTSGIPTLEQVLERKKRYDELRRQS